MTTPALAKSTFYRLRELFQDAIALAAGVTDKRRLLALLLVRRSDECLFGRCGELIAWIGVNRLAEAMRCDRRTVQRGLASLLDAGLLELDRKGGGRGRSSRYRFSKRWLAATALELEKSGVADAYGLPDDLFAFANGGGWVAEAVRHGQNGGADAADVAQNSGAFAETPEKKAASEAEKGGNFCGNSGAAVPPEIGINNRNKEAPPKKRAAHDPRQGYLTHAIPGWKSESEAIRRASDPRRETDERAQWRHRLAGYRDNGLWLSGWGEPPGERGCAAPPDLLFEILPHMSDPRADEAPPSHQDDRLGRVERLAAETAASVSAISRSLAEIMTALRATISGEVAA